MATKYCLVTLSSKWPQVSAGGGRGGLQAAAPSTGEASDGRWYVLCLLSKDCAAWVTTWPVTFNLFSIHGQL